MPQLQPIAPPSLFAPRPVRVWLVIGLFIVYLIVSYCIFFEAIAPVANFRIQPAIAADSGSYWEASGVRTTNFAEQQYAGASAGSNLFGPVLEAEVLRTDLNVALFNTLLFVACLCILRAMPEFDRGTFLLLMMANPLLLASMITLNKEIFALAGIVVFIRYTAAKRFRLWWLALALVLSLFARWQQMLVLLIYIVYESKISPLRGRRRWGIAVTLLGFTVSYALIYRIAPFFFAALLAQAEAGHTIVILDNIQANFGFPLVVIPKILMNCMGNLITPGYFLHTYPSADFTNWRDQIFMQLHTLFLTTLLIGMFLGRKLKLRHPAVYLLALYLLMTAINPMVQSRYEYSAYVLLCLEASRYFRLGFDGEATNRALSPDAALSPSLS
ncbi:MAG TPA: hypothetical protein VGM02_07515 [Acidobacteriaceae bacterium]|jgi:hypothetical protein